ncbi:MAG: SusF/SusE family outer membrane protein [Dysgonomonas sp.]|nr:SusF/SusE family outer membrane protein [Dysgonomonas sp.]
MKVIRVLLVIMLCCVGGFLKISATHKDGREVPSYKSEKREVKHGVSDAIPIKAGIDRKKHMRTVYAVGDAIPGEKVSMNPVAMALAEGTGTFEWTGYLKKGYFKFVMESAIQISLTPAMGVHEEIIPYYLHSFTNNNPQGESSFLVTEEGEYTIKLHLNGKHGKSIQLVPCGSQRSGVYITGDAASKGKGKERVVRMPAKREGFYEWTGFLQAGQFKFTTQPGTGSTLVPVHKSHTDVESYCQYRFANSHQGEHNFNLKAAGYYTISLDMYTKKFKIYPAGHQVVCSASDPKDQTSCNDFRAIGGKGYVKVRVAGKPVVQTAQLVNLDGRTFDRRQELSDGFVLGNRLPKGAYVVYITYDDNQVYTQKVNIR